MAYEVLHYLFSVLSLTSSSVIIPSTLFIPVTLASVLFQEYSQNREFANFPAAQKALLPDVCTTNFLTSFKYLLQVTMLIRSILYHSLHSCSNIPYIQYSQSLVSFIIFHFLKQHKVLYLQYFTYFQVFLPVFTFLFWFLFVCFRLSSLLEYKAMIFILFTDKCLEQFLAQSRCSITFMA